MKKHLRFASTIGFLFVMLNVNFGQAPDLGAASGFALFTSAGEFTNNGLSSITGDIGTYAGALTGFPPGTITGQIYTVGDPVLAQASTDLSLAYGYLSTLGGVVLGTSLGGQILTPGVYFAGAAANLTGDLTLDAGGDPDALFIIRIDGALSTSTFSNVLLTNSACICNVYWQITGAFELGDYSVFRGTVVSGGAISLLEGSTLLGRGLTTAGAVILHNNMVEIQLSPLPSIISAGGATTFCEGESVILSGNSGGTWSTGATTPSITVFTGGDYSVTNTNSCGSVTSNHIIVTVNPMPVASIITAGGATTFCEGESVILSGNTGGTWSTGATTPSITVFTGGDYSVTNTNSCGSVTSNHIIVTVDPLPVASIITAGGATTFCEGESVILSGNSGGTWSTGATTPSITVFTGGDYSVTNTNSCGSVTSNHIIVTVNALPVASIITAGGATTFCEGESVILSGNTGGTWSTGATTPSITVLTGGDYSVTNTNSCGSVTSNHIIVTVNALPVASIISAGGATTFCEGESVILSGNSGGTWSTGASTPSITVLTGGDYSVTNTNSCGSVTSNHMIVTVNALPVASIISAGGATTFCEGESVILSGNIGGTWSTGATTPSITVFTDGDYSVTNTNSCGSVTSNHMIVTVNALPVASIISAGGATTFCEGESVILSGNIGGTWSTGATTPSITVFTDGDYSVTNTNSCGSVTSNHMIVTVNALPVASIISAGGATTFCEGESVILSGNIGGTWSTGATTPSITVFTDGDYSVTNTNSCGSVTSNHMIVTVNALPVASIISAGGATTFCEGESVILSGNTGGAWSTGATTPSITVFTDGDYSVTNTNSCGSVTSNHIIVTVNTLPVASIITAGGATTFCEGESVILSGNTGGTWSTGATTPSITVFTSGDYSVTNTNSCGSATSNHIIVTVNPMPVASIISGGGATTFCEGESVILSGNSGGTWSTGASTPSITVFTSGDYFVTNTNSCGSVTSNHIIVTVNPLPVASIISADGVTTFCEEESVILSGNTGGTWSTGATTPSITVSTGGDYSVTNTNSCGSVTSNHIIVTVNVLPVASIISAGGATTFCEGESVILSGNSGGTWSTGASTPSITVFTGGDYSVTNTNSCGSVTSNHIIVTVNPVPAIDAGPDQVYCDQYTAMLAGNWPPQGSSGNWSFVSGPGPVSVGPSNSPFAIVSGMIGSTIPYIFRYTITTYFNGIYCSASDETTIINYHSPSPAYAGQDQQLCLTSDPTISATLQGNIPLYGSGMWSQYDGPSTAGIINPGSPTTFVNNLVAGSYTFFRSIGNGVCDSTVDEVVININSPAFANAGHDTTICEETPYYLSTSSASNYTSLYWATTGSGYFNNPALLHPVYYPGLSDISLGHVTLYLTALSNGLCVSAVDYVTLNIVPGPKANAGPDAIICENSTYCLCLASAHNYKTLYWTTTGTGYFTDPNILHPSYIPGEGDIGTSCGSCTYLVLHLTGDPPCSEVTDTMKLCISHIPEVYAGADTTVCRNLPFTLTNASAQDATSVTWSSSGDGTWDNSHYLHATYTAGITDLLLGHVTLFIHASGCSPCPNADDSMVLTFISEYSAGSASADQAICYNTIPLPVSATMPAGGSGDNHYQWQYTTDRSNWYELSGATDLIHSPGALTTTSWYRLQQTDETCILTVLTNEVEIFVFDHLNPGAVHSNQAICYSTVPDPVYADPPTGGQGIYNYLWQYSYEGVNWFDLPGETTLTYAPGSLIQTTRYRLQQNDIKCGTIYTELVTIIVNPLLTGDVSHSDIACFGTSEGTITISNTSGGGDGYEFMITGYPWQAGNIFTSLAPGSYDIFIRDASQITCIIDLGHVIIDEALQLVPSIDGDQDVCELSGAIYSTEPGMTEYFWTVTGAVSFTGQGTSSIYVDWGYSGIGTVAVHYRCSGETTIAVIINQLPVIHLAGPTPVCLNYDGNVYTTDPGMANYVWSVTQGIITAGGGLLDNTVTVKWTIAGVGNVSVNYADASTCAALVPVDVPVFVLPSPSFHIEGPANVCEYEQNAVYFAVFDTPSPIPGHVYAYQWIVTDNGVGLVSFTGQNSPTINVDWGDGSAGQVAVTVTDITAGEPLQCAACVIFPVGINPLPNPEISGCPEVVADDTCCYEVAYLPGHLWNWTIDGGEILDCGCGYRTCIHWLTPGSHIITVCETDLATGCSKCTEFTVIVHAGHSMLSGTVNYKNQYETPLNGVDLQLVNSAGTIVATTTSGPGIDADGYYAFTNIATGTYTINSSYSLAWGGVNATDALIDQLVFLGLYTFDHFDSIAGNVNADNYINPTDALWIKMRAIGMINYFPAGSWKFTDGPVVVPPGGATYQIFGLSIGDVNHSNIPAGLKEANSIAIVEDGTISVNPNESFLYSLRAGRDINMGAMTLFLKFNQDFLDVEEVVSAPEGIQYTMTDGKLNLAWSDPNAMKLSFHDALITLRLKVKSGIDYPVQLFSINEGSEFAGPDARIIETPNLLLSSVRTANSSLKFSLSNYPNPFKNNTTIIYTLPERGHVKLMLANLFGESVRTLVDEEQKAGYYQVAIDPSNIFLTTGTYLYRIIVDGVTTSYIKTNKIVFTR